MGASARCLSATTALLLGLGRCLQLQDEAAPEGPRQNLLAAGVTPEERLRRVLPIAWVHVPKSGGAIENAIVKLPGVCHDLPENKWVCSENNTDCTTTETGAGHIQFGKHDCPGISRWSSHMGFRTQYKRMKGHGFIMLRQPEQRLISGFYHRGGPHSWPRSQPPADLREYAEVVQGQAVKMLTHDGPAAAKEMDITEGDVADAVKKLREGFAFVGLTEEHQLSICLLHRMFGNPCNSHEFGVYHNGSHHDSRRSAATVGNEHLVSMYDVSELQGFTDEYDGRLYAVATEIFHRNLQTFNVSWSGCEPCFREAGVL